MWASCQARRRAEILANLEKARAAMKVLLDASENFLAPHPPFCWPCLSIHLSFTSPLPKTCDKPMHSLDMPSCAHTHARDPSDVAAHAKHRANTHTHTHLHTHTNRRTTPQERMPPIAPQSQSKAEAASAGGGPSDPAPKEGDPPLYSGLGDISAALEGMSVWACIAVDRRTFEQR